MFYLFEFSHFSDRVTGFKEMRTLCDSVIPIRFSHLYPDITEKKTPLGLIVSETLKCNVSAEIKKNVQRGLFCLCLVYYVKLAFY